MLSVSSRLQTEPQTGSRRLLSKAQSGIENAAVSRRNQAYFVASWFPARHTRRV
jgi:hypothetical protein